ncbi:hypothetical protein MAPG_12101 [Magnaporthiopsis poae ATCC 64411]|uniref:Uncharacterized protein n=1 Tax=Magnaporthiopsis poae (strain ATCC 64411 / 73-15) TaxID=644358 RepID=A0A0C4EGU5_MAGP6|nr:hypothetical protein MAPG_12101 [Magnaporthiopsis poae ATCC 64411]
MSVLPFHVLLKALDTTDCRATYKPAKYAVRGRSNATKAGPSAAGVLDCSSAASKFNRLPGPGTTTTISFSSQIASECRPRLDHEPSRGSRARDPNYYVASNAPEFLALPFRHITAPENMLLWPHVQRLLPGLRAASPLELELARYPEMEEMPEFAGPVRAPPWRPPKTIGDRLLGFLRARYLAAKSIIHRPFLHAVLHTKGIDSVAEGDVQKAALCLRAAFAGPIHAGILGDPFPLMQLPLNPSSRHWLRPYLGIPTAGYNAIIRTQDRVEREAAQMSPIAAADMAILRQLDSIEE